ncbi:MAG: hypothetical protein D8H97_23150 [Neisseria sp.]|nr:MAG: hypothetical protein D8H97_23150 [Neisseria sp.]
MTAGNKKQGQTAKRLIPTEWENRLSTEDWSDIWLLFALNMEDALLDAGATPGKDYSYQDLFRLSQPYVLHWLQAEEVKPALWFGVASYRDSRN